MASAEMPNRLTDADEPDRTWETRLDAMVEDVRWMAEATFALAAIGRISSAAGDALELSRCSRVWTNCPTEVSREFEDALWEAFCDGRLSRSDYVKIGTDVNTVTGWSRKTSRRVWVAVAASRDIGLAEVDDARRKAAMLGKIFPDDDTSTMVHGYSIDEAARRATDDAGVHVHLRRPAWE